MSAQKPTALRVKNLGFILKHRHPEAAELALSLAKFALSRGVRVFFASESASVAQAFRASLPRASAQRVSTVAKSKLPEKVDVVVVLGGDGTLLSIARLMAGSKTPLLGINMGQLGFLTEVKRSEALERLESILTGKPQTLSARGFLEVTLRRKNRVIFQGPVVNDAVISKGAIARIIGLELAVDGRWAHTVRADGIIVSTPTGSTAYSLAAGGPIIAPNLDALVITPICPHSLTQRPLVLDDRATIQICLRHEPGHVYLTLDGQDAVDLKQDDIITIRRDRKHRLLLISSPSRDYFSLLREKLHFGSLGTK